MKLREFISNLASGTTIRIIPMVHKMPIAQFVPIGHYGIEIVYVVDADTNDSTLEGVLLGLYMDYEVIDIAVPADTADDEDDESNYIDVFLNVRVKVREEELILSLFDTVRSLCCEKAKLVNEITELNFRLCELEDLEDDFGSFLDKHPVDTDPRYLRKGE